MKRERHGRASILTPDQIQLLFNSGLETERDRTLFGFCLYTACRINEACTQLTTDAYERTGSVRPYMTIRKGNSKGKLASRTLPTSEDLRHLLGQYRPRSGDHYLFPGRWGKGHIHPDSASLILREACRKVGLEGVSTHSFRRTALTQMSNAAIPFRVIAEVSGHHNLTQLHAYLEVKPEQVKGAIASLSQLSYVGKRSFRDVQPGENSQPQEIPQLPQ
ncbi:MAG: tyrosine-type recombinase/integrase [Brasilonema sp.]